jgi:hypothetical protein
VVEVEDITFSHQMKMEILEVLVVEEDHPEEVEIVQEVIQGELQEDHQEEVVQEQVVEVEHQDKVLMEQVDLILGQVVLVEMVQQILFLDLQ